MSTSVRATIEDFLSHHRIAMVGVSRNSKDFSRTLFHELESRGYDMVPVNPGAEEVDGKRCFDRISEVDPPVEAVLLMTPGHAAGSVIKDCVAAGVSRVWMYRAIGGGAVSEEALRLCEENRIAVVPGECPFMFLAGGAWYHGVHRFCRKLMGTLPA